MFWKEKVSWWSDLEAFFMGREVRLIKNSKINNTNEADIASKYDIPGIVRLLNTSFSTTNNKKVATAVTVQWVLETMNANAIWIVVKDRGGTVRGCIASFKTTAPYPIAEKTEWGLVDWYCVHPLWRSKGLGSALLNTLDAVTYERGRRAHVFLKEGMPLPLLPVYMCVLRYRRSGNPAIKTMPSNSKILHNYMTIEKATGLPLVRISHVESEEALDRDLPPCIVFTSSQVDPSRGWKTDSLVSMYAFRWTAGKWLGQRPISEII